MNITEKEAIYLKAWGAWMDDVVEKMKRGEDTTRLQELLIYCVEASGDKPPTMGSPICLMFVAFVAGLEMNNKKCPL